MITYSTKDIIDLATNLAGIEQVNYMKHKTSTQILNSEFSSLYELLIQNDDEAFTKTKTINKSESYLPVDFYKLRSVKDKHNNDTTAYRLVNNGIIFTDNQSEHTIQYWTVPPTLTYAADMVDYSDVGNITDSLNSCVIVDGTTIIDLESKKTVATLSEQAYLTPNSYITSSTSGALRYPSGYTTLCADIPVGAVAYVTEDYAYYVVDGVTYKYSLADKTTVESESMIYSFEDGHSIATVDDKIYVDGILMYQYVAQLHPLKFDIGTGYGFIMDNKLYSIVPDTTLDFPTTLHFTVLAYRLAVAMIAILGKEDTGVAMLAQQKEAQLLSQVRRNLCSVSRIKNVYF